MEETEMVSDGINEFKLKWHRVEDTLPENEPRGKEYPGDIPCITRAEGSLYSGEPNVHITKNVRRKLSYPTEKWVWDWCLPGYKIVAWAYPKEGAYGRYSGKLWGIIGRMNRRAALKNDGNAD